MGFKELEERISYTFRNKNHIRQALTHSSYAYEHQMRPHSDNERLEFLGDAVLEVVVSEFLYRTYPMKSEGEMSKLRSALVCEDALCESAKEIGLGGQILLGRGEDMTGGRERPSVLSDAFEAVIGAMFLDGGMEPAAEFISRYVLQDIENRQLRRDSKTILQELVQRDYDQALSYRLVEEKGPDHAKVFMMEALIGETVVGSGSGRSKKAAEQEAAYEALLKLKRRDNACI